MTHASRTNHPRTHQKRPNLDCVESMGCLLIPAAPAFNRENARAAKRPIAQGETLKKKHATRIAIQSFGPRGSHQDAQPRAEAGTKHFHAIAFLDPVRSRKITASINRATKVHAHQTAGIHGETPLAIFLVVKRSATSLKHTAKFQHI